MKKTLGGDRLGSGNDMKVDLHNYGRSTHDPGYLFRTTMSAGTLVPFICELGLPGDTFDIKLQCEINTHPTVGPLFGSFKVQLDVFQAPIRLYQGKLHNNKLGIGLNMAAVKLPLIQFDVDPITIELDEEGNVTNMDNKQVNPSAILAYLGIRGFGLANTAAPTNFRNFNGVPLLAYWDIYKNYYSNKQEEEGAVIHTPPVTAETTVDTIEIDNGGPAVILLPQAPTVANIGMQWDSEFIVTSLVTNQPISQIAIKTVQYGTVQLNQIATLTSTVGLVQRLQIKPQYLQAVLQNWAYQVTQLQPIQITRFPLSNIDDMREAILSAAAQANPFDIFAQNLEPYELLTEKNALVTSIQQSQEGLGLKTYQSDLFNNWLQTDWIDGAGGIAEVTAIDTSGGEFTIDTLLLARKVYDMLNRIAVSGGSYDDWLDAVYTHDRYTKCESPIYHGGLIKELVFQEVVSNSESGSEGNPSQPLGTLAGKGVMSGKHKGGTVRVSVDEPGYIIGIISLTPRIDYSQGNKWDTHLETMDDLHKPGLDEIGFQELITEQMAWWDTVQQADGTWVTKSAGKQPAWVNYMTNVNKCYGNFAIEDNEMFMTLNRRYRPEQTGTETVEIGDLTTYIDPAKYNQIFAETALDSQNFWTQISVDMTARRKLSAKLMPNL